MPFETCTYDCIYCQLGTTTDKTLERQRTALARAFINSPSVILADEPTGNLDRENAEIVIESLVEFVNAGGSVLLGTHDAHAAQYAAKILCLENVRVRDNHQD